MRGGIFNLAKRITAGEVPRGPIYGSRAPYCFFKQPEFGINSPERTTMQSGKARTCEVGGYAAEDQRQIPISRTRIDHIGSADIKC